ncbi:hypothetical protein [Haloterrigena salinisoli]|uniref:hypothetical protein n=1 Tax=Haloterrigena salinisoli TaxID=3132747 RepID=UPI0030D32C51
MIELALVPLQAGEEVTMPSTETLLIQLAVLLLLGIGAGYWVYRDASKRENNELRWAIGAGVVMFLFPPAGVIALIVYYFVRGDATDGEPTAAETTGNEWDSPQSDADDTDW